ncbi:MAG TPA: signal peptidase I [Smithellaceae bacterium]|nr:signal peptidase I [Smithellaceae bacterium]
MADKKAKNASPDKIKGKVKEYAEAIIIAILIAVVIRTFIIAAYKIPSGSMKPTLLIGDHLMVNKFIYGVKIPYFRKTIIPVTDPERGDIIVFIYPQDRSKDYIKRVIGKGGDKIEIKNKKIFLNGKEYSDGVGVYSDSKIYPAAINERDNFGPVTVPQGHLFVMGDNRDESMDSRFWGFVDLKDVEGKALIIYWSWDAEERSPRLGRLGNLLK